MTRKELYRRNVLLKNILIKHKGIDNAISTKDICDELNKCGYKTKERSLPSIMQKLRCEMNLPVCFRRRKGYFIAKAKSDIMATIDDLQSQINTLQTTINFMKGFILE